MKTQKIVLNSVKSSDLWMELCHNLLFDKFKEDNPGVDEDELLDKFYNEVVLEKFEHGEYANLEIVIDEHFNIVGGKIL